MARSPWGLHAGDKLKLSVVRKPMYDIGEERVVTKRAVVRKYLGDGVHSVLSGKKVFRLDMEEFTLTGWKIHYEVIEVENLSKAESKYDRNPGMTAWDRYEREVARDAFEVFGEEFGLESPDQIEVEGTGTLKLHADTGFPDVIQDWADTFEEWKRRKARERRHLRRNPGAPSDAEMNAVEKIKGVEEWMLDEPGFWEALRKYKEFHGKYPDKLEPREVEGTADGTFLVGMGKAMDTTYKPTDKKSSKYGSAYIHEFADNKDEPAEGDLPDRACSADGKTIFTFGGKFGVRDWVRG